MSSIDESHGKKDLLIQENHKTTALTRLIWIIAVNTYFVVGVKVHLCTAASRSKTERKKRKKRKTKKKQQQRNTVQSHWINTCWNSWYDKKVGPSGEWQSARTQFVELTLNQCWVNVVCLLGCHSFGVSPVPVLNYPDLDLQSMRGSRKFCQSGPTLTRFFFIF